MNLKDLRPIASSNTEVDSLYRNLKEFVQQLTQNPLIRGQHLKDITLQSSAVLVPHSLGQAWTGYLVTRQDNLVNVSSERTEFDDKYLKLTSDTTVSVDLWVF